MLEQAQHSEYLARKSLPWQEQALRVVDLVPELDYVSRFYARMLKQLRLFPAFRSPNGDKQEIKEGPPVEVLSRIRDAGGGQSEILASYGRLMFLTGEGNLFGYDLGTEVETWTFVWNDELSVERAGDTIKKIIWRPSASGPERVFGPEEAVVYKFWTPHPRRSGEATSPMRAIVEGDVAEELIALTRSVRATAVSRTTKGILVIPDEVQPPPLDDDPDLEENTWLAEIAAHLELQIEHAGQAAAAAPYLMNPPYEYADRIRLVQLHDPQHDYAEAALRKEAVERIARGVDFPPEALTGIGASNHWAALQILMDMWRSHGAPIAQTFCDDLSAAYLRPALREAGYEQWANVVVAYDESQVTTKPDRSDDARTAVRELAIGPSGLRKLLNIPDEYAPTDEEIELMLKARSRGQAVRIEPRSERDPAAGPLPPNTEGDSPRPPRVSQGRQIGVIELALMRCRELAGIRLRQKAQRHFPEYLDVADSVPLSELAYSLGQEAVRRMGFANTVALVQGGADNLRSLLRVWGYSADQADLFGEVIEVKAAGTLFSPSTFTDNDLSELALQLERV
ncbi:MAG: hypothetical protein KatS3mg015_2544 [Fimbriimonadales bacterium]|nr:MAG: hypothetical protein KatS3mg015_2544 [Fimbriimonadales bacterium]